MLGGPWRLTEPCDVTIGGATWLDQAQETAARTEPECRSTQEEGGATESCTNQSGAGSIQDRRGNRQLQIHTGRKAKPENCPPIAKMSTQVHRRRGDAGRGMGLQRGGAEAKRTARTSFRSIWNLVILISSMGRALTLGVCLPLRLSMLKI